MQLAARVLRLAPVAIRRLSLGSARTVRLRNEPPAGVRWVHGGQVSRKPLCGLGVEPSGRGLGIGAIHSEPQRAGIAMVEVADRITVNPEQCGGRPCIRGLRIRVIDVLDLLASGLTAEQVLEELPDLEAEDIVACLRYASRRIDHPVLAA